MKLNFGEEGDSEEDCSDTSSEENENDGQAPLDPTGQKQVW